MSQKNETTILALTLLLKVGIVNGGVWWFTNGSGVRGVPLRAGIANDDNPEIRNTPVQLVKILLGSCSRTGYDFVPVR